MKITNSNDCCNHGQNYPAAPGKYRAKFSISAGTIFLRKLLTKPERSGIFVSKGWMKR
jgi:hypothetical protein